MQQTPWKCLLKQLLGSTSKASNSVGLGWGWELAVLTRPHMLLLLIPGTHLENHCCLLLLWWYYSQKRRRYLWVLECGYLWGPPGAWVYRNRSLSLAYTWKDWKEFRFAGGSQWRSPEQLPHGLRGQDKVEGKRQDFSGTSCPTWVLLFSKALFR